MKKPPSDVTIDTSKNGFLGSGGYGNVRIGKTDALGIVAVKTVPLKGSPSQVQETFNQ